MIAIKPKCYEMKCKFCGTKIRFEPQEVKFYHLPSKKYGKINCPNCNNEITTHIHFNSSDTFAISGEVMPIYPEGDNE